MSTAKWVCFNCVYLFFGLFVCKQDYIKTTARLQPAWGKDGGLVFMNVRNLVQIQIKIQI